MRSTTRRFLLPYAIVILFAYIGFSLPLPILPEMFLDPEKSIFPAHYDLKLKMLLLGIVMASFPLGQFWGSPFLGHLSDRYGRKKIILFSLAGTTVGYLITAASVAARSIPGMFFGLAFCGFCEGNVTIAQSVIADLTHEGEHHEEKAVHFGWINIFISLGFIIGPLMGGQLADSRVVGWFTFATPFWVAACMTVIGMGIIFKYSKETRVTKRLSAKLVSVDFSVLLSRFSILFRGVISTFRILPPEKESKIGQNNPKTRRNPNSQTVSNDKKGEWRFFQSVWAGFRRKRLRLYYVANFFLAMGYFSFFRFLPVFLERMFDFSPAELGYIMVYNALMIGLGVVLLIPPLARRFKPIQSLAIFSFLLGISFIICVLPSNPYALLITIPPVGLFLAVTITNGSLVISNEASKEFQGQALGTLTSVQVLAEFLTGIFGGVFFAAQTMALPLYIGALMSIVCGTVLLIRSN